MNTTMRLSVSFLFSIIALALVMLLDLSTAFGAPLLYPELHVTPRASQRLAAEASKENSSRWTLYAPIQLSGIMNIATGLYTGGNKRDADDQETSDNADMAANMSVGIGAAWVLLTGYMSATYTPYQDKWAEIKKMPTGTKQQRLAKERMAEEALEAPARVARRMTFLSVVTNLGAAAFVGSFGNQKATILAGVSGITALAPLLFKHHWQLVSNYHQEYKKKIYGPVASATFLRTDKGEIIPGVGLSLRF